MVDFKFHRTHLVRGAVVVHDLLAVGTAMVIGLTLRLGGLPGSDFALPIVLYMAIAGLLGYIFGLNGGVWRYASLSDIEAVIKTATISVFAFALALFLFNRLDMFPRAAIVATWGATILLLSGSRLAYRLLRNHRSRVRSDDRRNVLLLGATANAENFLKAVSERADLPYRVVGLIDDRDRRTGLSIRGCRVLGNTRSLDAVIEKLARRGIPVEALVLTNTGAGRDDLPFETIADAAKRLNLQLLRLPTLNDLEDKPIKGVAALVPQPIVLEDLLPRRAVDLDKQNVSRLIAGTTVLVTGAGGSIGSELCRQILSQKPRRMILLDSSEYLLYAIDNELQRTRGDTEIVSRLGNVRNRNHIRSLFDEVRPELVFHAAALKHVPIVEHQPLEGLNTNVLGTRNVADAALAVGAKAMVLISTDKAVNPTNVMGASKRMAESYCQALDVVGKTHFVTVRFGNVLGSAGSVVPLFEKQIRTGGPVTDHASRDRTLLHDHPGGVPAGAPRSQPRRRRQGRARADLRPRHGTAGEDRRRRPQDDPVGRVRARQGHRDQVHRSAPRRKDARGAVPPERGTGRDQSRRRVERISEADVRPHRSRGDARRHGRCDRRRRRRGGAAHPEAAGAGIPARHAHGRLSRGART